MANILILHGPNLNLLGTREPYLYGNLTLDKINDQLRSKSKQYGLKLDCVQSNAEYIIIDTIHNARDVDLIIINPAALTHTSIALRDALLAVGVPFIEVHLSNVYNREKFRHHSYISDCALGIIGGFGPQGYELALQAAINYLEL